MMNNLKFALQTTKNSAKLMNYGSFYAFHNFKQNSSCLGPKRKSTNYNFAQMTQSLNFNSYFCVSKIFARKITEKDVQIQENRYKKAQIEQLNNPEILLAEIDKVIEFKQKYYGFEQYDNFLHDVVQKTRILLQLERNTEGHLLLDQILKSNVTNDTEALAMANAVMLKWESIHQQQESSKLEDDLKILYEARQLIISTDKSSQTCEMAKYYEIMAKIFEKYKNIDDCVKNLENMCQIYEYLLEENNSKDDQIILLIRQSGSLLTLAKYYRRQQNIKGCLECLNVGQKNWELLIEENSHLKKNPFYIMLLSYMGRIFHESRDTYNSLIYNGQVKEIVEFNTNSMNVGPYLVSTLMLAENQMQMNDLQQALENIETVERKAKQFNIDDYELLTQIQEVKFRISKHLFDFPQQIKCLDQILKIMKNNPEVARTTPYASVLIRKGNIYFEQEKFKECIQPYKEAFDIFFKKYQFSNSSIGTICKNMGIAQYYLGKQQKNQQLIDHGFQNLEVSEQVQEAFDCYSNQYNTLEYLVKFHREENNEELARQYEEKQKLITKKFQQAQNCRASREEASQQQLKSIQKEEEEEYVLDSNHFSAQI